MNKKQLAWPLLLVAVILSIYIYQQLVKEEKSRLVKEAKQQAAPKKEQTLPNFANQHLLIFAGVAAKPPTEEIAEVFQKKTNAHLDINYGGSGKMLAEINLIKKGDIFFPASSDWMETAKREKIVYPETERKIAYLVPAILVPKGNLKNIRTIADFLRPDVKVGLANPETVAVGAYAIELLEKNLTPQQQEQFRNKNLVTYFESAEKTANAISFKAIDAAINWSVVQAWDPENIETVKLKPQELSRIGYIPIAVTKFTKNYRLAKAFIDFISSKEGLAIFKKHGYFITSKEALNYIGANKPMPVGGWFDVPKEWLNQ